MVIDKRTGWLSVFLCYFSLSQHSQVSHLETSHLESVCIADVLFLQELKSYLQNSSLGGVHYCCRRAVSPGTHSAIGWSREELYLAEVWGWTRFWWYFLNTNVIFFWHGSVFIAAAIQWISSCLLKNIGYQTNLAIIYIFTHMYVYIHNIRGLVLFEAQFFHQVPYYS